MILHGFSYSGSTYRVRIALNLKGIAYEQRSVHLVRGGGEQHAQDYRRLSPLGVVPTLVDGDVVVTQSGAIVEYLDEIRPAPPLLPEGAAARARVRALAQTLGVDSHPLVTIRVLRHLHATRGDDDAAQKAWSRHWLAFGLAGGETLLAGHPDTGRYCHGNRLSLADLYLVPQALAALRHDIALEAYPTIDRIYRACLAHPAVAAADPQRQPDALSPEELHAHLAPGH
jgi:maleylacetoacetate isomerase